MSDIFKVRVVRHFNFTYWYTDQVGQCFYVREVTRVAHGHFYGLRMYVVVDELGVESDNYLLPADCEVVSSVAA